MKGFIDSRVQDTLHHYGEIMVSGYLIHADSQTPFTEQRKNESIQESVQLLSPNLDWLVRHCT